MKKSYFKMLAIVALLVAGSGTKAYSTIWDAVWSADFSSEPTGLTYTVQETTPNSPTVSWNSGVLLYFQGDGSGQRSVDLKFAEDVFKVEEPWRLEFDFGCSSGNKTGNADGTSTIDFVTSTGVAFTMTWEADAEKVGIRYNDSQSQFTSGFPNDGTKKSTDAAKINNMSRFTIIGDETGVYLSIIDCNGKIYAEKRIQKTFAYPVSLGGKLGRAHSYMAIDNMEFSKPMADDELITNLNLNFTGTTEGNLTYILGEGEVAAGNLTGQFWNTNSDKQQGVQVTYAPSGEGNILRLANGNLTAELADWENIQPLDVVSVSFDLALGYSYRSPNNSTTIKALNSNGGTIFEEVFNAAREDLRSSTIGIPSDAVYYPLSQSESTYWNNRTHFEIVLDYANGTITGITTNESGYATLRTSSTIKMTEAQMVPIKSIYLSTDDMGHISHTNMLANLVVKTQKGDYSNARTVTYKYVTDKNEDITAHALAAGALVSATPAVGTTYTPVYPKEFTGTDYAYDYKYKSGGNQFTVTSDETITIVYSATAHPTTDVKVKYTLDGKTVKTVTIAKAYPEGKPLTYWVNKYLPIDGTLYETQAFSGSYQRDVEAKSQFSEKLTATEITNVVYFTEAEDIAGVTVGETPTRASNGKEGYTPIKQVDENNPMKKYEFVEVTTIAAGKYKLYMNGHNGNSLSKTGAFRIGETDSVLVFNIYNGTNIARESEEFVVEKASTLYFGCEGSSSAGVDYFYLVKTEDIADFVTIDETGFATFAATHDVDLRELPEDAAFYVEEKGFVDGVLVLTPAPAAVVPAGTGLIFAGTPGQTYEVLWVVEEEAEEDDDTTGDEAVGVDADDATDAEDGADGEGDADEEEKVEVTPISGNLLVGCLADTNLNASDDTYVMVNNNNAAEFHLVAESTMVAAGNAYLKLPESLKGKSVLYLFYGEGDPTAINAPEAVAPASSGIYYNLAGQRVQNPVKGIYIVDGKKVLVK